MTHQRDKGVLRTLWERINTHKLLLFIVVCAVLLLAIASDR